MRCGLYCFSIWNVVGIGWTRASNHRRMGVAERSSKTRNTDRTLTDSDFRDQAEFRAALRRFLRYSEEQSRVYGITPQQHLLLLAVRGHANYPNVSIGDVAEALRIRHHSASLLVD